MRYRSSTGIRRGTVIPLLAISLIALLALLALAIDIGMIAVARNQAQNAADAAAVAAVRVLNGDTANNNNFSQAAPTAKAVLAANMVLGQPIPTSGVSTEIGYYAYNSAQKKFVAHFTGSKPANENWTAARVLLTTETPTFFARAFGFNSMAVTADSTAVHRPRDIAIILDFSGSMQYASEFAYPSSGDITGSLNPDPVFPRFGHWSVMSSVMQRTTAFIDSGGEVHGPTNLTMSTENGPPIIDDFLTRDSSGNLINAFNRSGGTYNPSVWACPAPADWATQSNSTQVYWKANSSGVPDGTGLGGDPWPRIRSSQTAAYNFGSGNYAKTCWEFIRGSNPSFTANHNKNGSSSQGGPFNGPGGGPWDPANPSSPANNEGYGPNFKGYSMGPGYYGKTFFIWPPDPRFHPSANTAAPHSDGSARDTSGRWMADWRKRFFYNGGTTTPLNGDNSRLWNTSTKQWNQAGSSTYAVNYTAIVRWIKSGPQVLPDNLRAGRVLYYSSIPDTIPATGGTEDQRFWRAYIDYVIANGTATFQKRIGYGRQPDSDSSFGTTRITARSSITGANSTVGDSDDPYMNYADNPVGPRLQFWFGPLTMVCFLATDNDTSLRRNWLPGTCHESQSWHLKAGVQSALNDIQKNHPNDWASLIYFSGINEFNTPRVTLGREYTKMKNALFFPFNRLDDLDNQYAEVRPYDSNFNSTASGNIPNALGSTSPQMGFYQAYNMFSTATGYNGRRGAAKVVIFETDGVPNTPTSASYTRGVVGSQNGFYSNLSSGTNQGNNNSTTVNQALGVVQAICNLDTHSTTPGYSTSKVPARVHAIAFGDLFQTNTTAKAQALDFVLRVQKIGNTSAATDSSIESYKIVTGDFETRIENMRTAFERIMQSGVQVSLIR